MVATELVAAKMAGMAGKMEAMRAAEVTAAMTAVEKVEGGSVEVKVVGKEEASPWPRLLRRTLLPR